MFALWELRGKYPQIWGKIGLFSTYSYIQTLWTCPGQTNRRNWTKLGENLLWVVLQMRKFPKVEKFTPNQF